VDASKWLTLQSTRTPYGGAVIFTLDIGENALSLKHDLEFIARLADEFFRRPHVKRILTAIEECKMTGWEKWLQIELSAFLDSHSGVKAWWRESKYDLDQRVLDSRKKCAVDFLVQEKWKQSHMALELKQINSANGCVKSMIRDKKKIAAIKYAKYDIRSVWCLGVHRKVDPAEVHRLTAYHADKLKTEIPTKLVVCKAIGRTDYAYTIF